MEETLMHWGCMLDAIIEHDGRLTGPLDTGSWQVQLHAKEATKGKLTSKGGLDWSAAVGWQIFGKLRQEAVSQLRVLWVQAEDGSDQACCCGGELQATKACIAESARAIRLSADHAQ